MAAELEMMILTGDHPLIGGAVEFFETEVVFFVLNPIPPPNPLSALLVKP